MFTINVEYEWECEGQLHHVLCELNSLPEVERAIEKNLERMVIHTTTEFTIRGIEIYAHVERRKIIRDIIKLDIYVEQKG